MRGNKEIEAVHKRDLSDLLKSLELLDSFNGGELHCTHCGNPVGEENIGAILSKNGEIVICCSDLLCLNKVQYPNL